MLMEKMPQNNRAPSLKASSEKLQLKNKCQVEIFGRQYTLRSDTDESYAMELASLVDQKMNELATDTKGIDREKLAIFTAINMAHDLIQIKTEQKEKEAEMNRKTCNIIENIEKQFEAF